MRHPKHATYIPPLTLKNTLWQIKIFLHKINVLFLTCLQKSQKNPYKVESRFIKKTCNQIIPKSFPKSPTDYSHYTAT